MLSLSKTHISIGVLVVLHLVGIIGLSSSYRPYFLILTPINLVVSGYFVFRHGKRNQLWLFLLIAVLTYFVELLGVHTGFPFGDYRYGTSLGPQLYSVPILIGLLWLLLLLGASNLAKNLTHHLLVHAGLVALMLTALDFAIEPVAIKLDFWRWFSGSIPWNNYLGWFVTALLLAFVSKKDSEFGNNTVAGVFFIIQVVFFVSLNFIL